MVKFLKSFVADESGASAAEYALILAVVGSAIGIAALALGGEIRDAVVGAEANVQAAQGALPACDGANCP
jgi:pilus assembly protein Flp/PilA